MNKARLLKFAMCLAITGLTIPQSNAQSYGVNDARYVTASKDIDVLNYIVCLQGSFNKQPRRMKFDIALDAAARECRTEARNLPIGPTHPNVKEIKQSIKECGFSLDDDNLSHVCYDSPITATNSFVPDITSPTPEIIEVGKWAEGLSYGNGYLWVSESGQRTTAQIDLLPRTIVDRYKVGRLPVETIATDSGNAYTLVSTDRKIMFLQPNRKPSRLTKLEGCPDKMISSDEQTLWVLGWPDCSSDTSNLSRIDTRTGRVKKSADLGPNALDIASFGNDIWVSHSRGAPMSVVNKTTMRTRSVTFRNADLWSLTKGDNHIYGGGRPQNTSNEGVVVKIDPSSSSIVARASLPSMIVEIATDGFAVYALSEDGTIWVLSADELELLRTIKPKVQPYLTRSAIIADGQLVVSAQKYKGENGAIFIFDDLLPDLSNYASSGNALPLPNSFPIAAVSLGGKMRIAPDIRSNQIGSTKHSSTITLLANSGRNYQNYPWFKIRSSQGEVGYQWGGGICMNNQPIDGMKGLCPRSKPQSPVIKGPAPSAPNSNGKLDSSDVVIGILGIVSQIIENKNNKNQASQPLQVSETALAVRAQGGAAVSRGSLAAGELTIYSVEGRKGQTLRVNLTSQRGNPGFEIYIDQAKSGGITLAGAGKGANATSFQGQLPKDGSYKIVVGDGSGASAFRLAVSLEDQTTASRYNKKHDRYIGTYESSTGETGNIERNGNSLMWSDFRGRSFGLTVDRRNMRLIPNGNRRRAFELNMRKGKVLGFQFGRHTYTRAIDDILPVALPANNAANSCNLRGKVVSTSVAEGAKAVFINQRDNDIHIYWINYSGVESNYSGGSDPFFSLVPGQWNEIDTRVGFAFLVADGSGNCIDVVKTDQMKNEFEFADNIKNRPDPRAATDYSLVPKNRANLCLSALKYKEEFYYDCLDQELMDELENLEDDADLDSKQ